MKQIAIAELMASADDVLKTMKDNRHNCFTRLACAYNAVKRAEIAEAVGPAEPAPVTSPFVTYRAQILGGYGTAGRLRRLVMHLWNSDNKADLASLVANADEKHTRIALELIAHYGRFGENDQSFMKLADDIISGMRV